MDKPKDIGLDKVLEGLREEVQSAWHKAARQDLHFPIQTLTVELKVAVTRRADGKAGFRVPLVGAEIGGSAGYDRESMQTITLVLGSPVDRDGRPVKVAASTHEPKG